MIEVRCTSGDSAFALEPSGAVLAALTMLREVPVRGPARETVSFLVDGRLVQDNVRFDQLTAAQAV